MYKRQALEELPEDADMMQVAERIKQTAFKITRAGELMSREAARRLGVDKGIVDLSLAPTPAIGDSVARILEICLLYTSHDGFVFRKRSCMSAIDFVILTLVAVAFIAVVRRIRKKGTCADCASAGSCSGSCSSCSSSGHAACPACEGVDRVAEKLARNVDKS